ncbi:unnamed protein product, partial [Meganyctiphanes norvegica]
TPTMRVIEGLLLLLAIIKTSTSLHLGDYNGEQVLTESAEVECEDKYPICDRYMDHCKDNIWTKQNCQKTCGSCIEDPEGAQDDPRSGEVNVYPRPSQRFFLIKKILLKKFFKKLFG